MINRKQFFAGFRELIDPTIAQEQVDGLNFLLGKMESDPFWVHIPQTAYALATVYHETAGSMQPVEEGYYLGSPARVKAFQRKLRYFPYFGRGYLQLTWKKNYQKAEAEFGHDLVKHPENALDPNVAYLVLTYGMHQGWFTGKKLDDYIKGVKKDYVNARRIVNGTDKAGLIAGYAKSFEEILKDSTAASSSLDTASISEKTDAHSNSQSATPEQPSIPLPVKVDANTVLVPQAIPAEDKPDMLTRINTRFTALGTSALAAVAALWAAIKDMGQEIIVALIVVSGVVLLVWVVLTKLERMSKTKQEEETKRQREQQAHELTVLQANSAASKDMNTVVVVPNPIANSEAPEAQ